MQSVGAPWKAEQLFKATAATEGLISGSRRVFELSERHQFCYEAFFWAGTNKQEQRTSHINNCLDFLWELQFHTQYDSMTYSIYTHIYINLQ